MCSQDFTVMSGNVLGVRQGSICFIKEQDKGRGDTVAQVHANMV